MISRLTLAVASLVALCTPTAAIVGGAQNASVIGKHIVMIVGVRGNRATLCTGTALTRDLVLTGAHCVAPEGRYQVVPSLGSAALAIATIAQHPRYDAREYSRGRVTADVALIKLAAPLPTHILPVALATAGSTVAAGDRLLIAGFGVTTQTDDAKPGAAKSATLVVTGRPGTLQIRLVDPATRGARFGLGACVGDSGGPAFRETNDALAVIGVVSWSTGPADEEGCGGMTGVTPLTNYRGWVVEQAAKLGSRLQ